MKPFFSYLGSKYSMTRQGLYGFPPAGSVVVEPFAGSAGFSTAVDSRKTVLYDRFIHVVNAWRFLINVTPAEMDSLPDRVDDVADFPDLTEPQLAIIRWLLKRADRRPVNRLSKWGKQSWPSASVWSPARKQLIMEQADRIREWEIHQLSYADIPLDRYGEDTWWFVDPPYIELESNGYTFGPKKIDFEHLGEWCRSLPGYVTVCEMDNAAWLPFRTLKDNITASNKRAYREVIWTNEKAAEAIAAGREEPEAAPANALLAKRD